MIIYMSTTEYKNKVNKLKWLTPSLVLIYFLLTLFGVLIITDTNNKYNQTVFAVLLIYTIPLQISYSLDDSNNDIKITSIVLYSLIGLIFLYSLYKNKLFIRK
jgi:hypothetical protein